MAVNHACVAGSEASRRVWPEAGLQTAGRDLGHASPSTTLNIYAHLFDEARHAADVRARMARSAFAGFLNADEDDDRVVTLPAAAKSTVGPLSARQRAAIK